MKKHQLKNYLKLGILLFGVSVFIIACQQDDLESNENVQVLIPKGKSYVKINTGNNVSENAVNFLKEKTNNTLGVIISNDNVRLFLNGIANRTSALGTVDTSKEVVVINETNTKHTFKVDNPDDTSNNVTNIIVVENKNETYEYFLKYNFDGGIPYNTDGTVDLSRFTGTIDAYDSDGQRTGGISISNGEVIDNDGQTTPCPDDNTTPPDDDDDNDNQTGGGAQGEVGDGSPDSGDNGGTNDDQGGGGWFDGGPDWNPCTISYHRECSNGYSGEHEPTEINTAGDLCSGTLNGAGVLVVTDCNGTVLGSGRYMNRTGENETINPCGGTTGVLLEDKHEQNCEELQTNSNNDLFKQNMQTLKDEINGSVEKGFPMYNGNHLTPPSPLNPVVGDIVSGTGQETPNLGYNIVMKSLVHNHLKAEVHKHIGTFTPRDISQFVNLITAHQQQNSPVPENELTTYLVCFEGNYALKISDDDKLYNFALKYGTNSAFKDRVDRFYKRNKMLHGKPKQDQNIGFLKLIEKFDMGAELYESDDNFKNWEQLELNDSENNINKKPC
jgi:hypothetical protein